MRGELLHPLVSSVTYLQGCEVTGDPTVILDQRARDSNASWAAVMPRLLSSSTSPSTVSSRSRDAARLIGLPVAKVEKKLAQMVLDKKLRGVLAQGEGQLILHAELAGDATHDGALDVIRNVSDVVESLFARAKALDV